jgi:hypothetical protein
VPAVLPPGFAIDSVQDIPHPAVARDLRSQIIVYGDPLAADPFAAGGLEVQASSGPAAFLAGYGQPVDVNGHPGEFDESFGYVQLRFSPADHVLVVFSTSSLSVADVTAAARATTVDDDLQLTVPALPAGLREVARSSFIAGIGGVPVQEGTVAHEAVYIAPAEGVRQMAVGTLRGGLPQILIQRYQFGQQAVKWEATTVRGHPAWRSGDGLNSAARLMWQETPDVVVVMNGLGVSAEQVAATAESLARISDAEWARLPQYVPPAATASNEPRPLTAQEVSGIGGFALVTAEANGDVCVHIDTPHGITDRCVDPSTAPALRVVPTLDNAAVVWGVVPGRVDGVQTLIPNELSRGAQSVEVPGRSYRIVAFALPVTDPQMLQVSSITFELGLFDSDATETASAPVG